MDMQQKRLIFKITKEKQNGSDKVEKDLDCKNKVI